MLEKISELELLNLKHKKDDIKINLNDGLLHVETNEGIYDEKITLQEEQSVKKEIIDIFVKILEQNNIFEGKLSVEEARKKLETNINAAYVVDKGGNRDKGGFWNIKSKNLYICSPKSLTPEQLKQYILNEDIEQLNNIERLGVLCHEVLHALSTNENGQCGFVKYDDERGSLGISITEGMTQILTKQMVPFGSKAYEREVEITKYLIAILGNDMKEAYLNANFDAIMNMAEEKGAATELMKLISLSDYRYNLSENKTNTKDIEEQIDVAIVELINKIGEIDISKLLQYYFQLPVGINEEIIKNAIEEALLNDEKLVIRTIMQKYPKLVLEIIDSKNNGEINFEEYLKNGIANYNENKVAQHFLEKGADFKTYCKSIINAINLIEESDLQGIIGALLYSGIEINKEHSNNSDELTAFKIDIIEEIVYQDMGVYINTARSQEEYSWERMISDIENFEYYETDEANFLVNSKNGTMLGLSKNAEIINIEEDIALQETSTEEKNSNAIKYNVEGKEPQVFLTEKNKEGKYILKGYIQDAEGTYLETDVGLARNFCDDTTQIDRQIVSATAEVRSGSIKEVAEKIKNEILKDKHEEKEIVAEGKKEDNGER